MIPAQSAADAERLGDEAIARAMDRFTDQQRLFHVTIETDSGTIMGKRHYGALIQQDHPDVQAAKSNGLNAKGWFVDNSPDDQIPGMAEAETTDLSKATGLEKVINLAPQIQQLAGMPDLLKATISPISEQINRVEAMVNGGITQQQQYHQMINFMTKALDEMAAMRKELEELRKKVNG